ncbi:DNA-directed RNA polymerase subunit alpha C-terminal domain-containing protein [Paraburkholderia caffeinilytica]|uniref:DNA-directed RNA polymerase subunit alpha C-terminal domain-containing protein n=1 Tax=Paraburkholderia caffeinilytica TaxID=1761016 RepID=UPI003DA0FDE0
MSTFDLPQRSPMVSALLAQQPVTVLGVTARITNRLQAAGIWSIGELCAHSLHDLQLIQGIGEYSAHCVADTLALRGLSLKG